MPATTKIKHAGRLDDDTARDIRQALKLDSDAPDERISVQVHSGIATLDGNVDSSLQKEAAAADAKKVNGGHRSVYTEMLPLVQKATVPVTLFIYPSAISHASYALTWPELRELNASGLFDVQSHTYWHPNFKSEQRRLDPRKYQEFVAFQLTQSKLTLERMLGCRVDLLAWPFGIYDDELIQMAAHSGYVAAFTIERRAVRESDSIMALPRFLIEDSMDRKAFNRMLQGALAEKP
jgi:peptidoglycan/xylan/chitin deacetylase (PgdA/CDA1 family)